MKTLVRIVIAAVSGFSFYAHAACELPFPTAVRVLPNGATATEQELVAARAEISAYVEVAKAYVDCIDQELAAAGAAASAEYKTILVNRRNAAVTEQETVAAAFNRARQAFRAAHPEAQAASQPSSSAASPASSQAPPR
jgi:hypothetical protein